ncbi:unnamed protein product, partial [Linum tenue]
MNTQLDRPHYDHQQHHHELEPHDAGVLHTTTGAEGSTGEEHHHHGGVKSVLKKVKQKAKKVKDTLKVHGHHDHHNTPDDHDLDEEEDDDVDEEMIQDPAIHGASATVAAGLGSGVAGKSSMQPDYYDGGYSAADPMKMTPSEATGENRGGPLEAGENRGGQGRKLADIKEEPFSPFNSPVTISTTPMKTEHPKATEPAARAFVARREEDRGHPQITMDEVITGGLEQDPHAPKGSSGPVSSPSNHQTKTFDRTDAGGEEAGIPLTVLESLEKAHISDEGRNEDHGLRRRTRDDVASALPTGSHNQFSPEGTRPQPISNFESAKHEDKLSGGTDHNQSSYSDKISSATAAIADKAISAKNVVASKLGYGSNTTGEQRHHQPDAGAASNLASPVEYGKKVAATVTEKLTPVYETVTSTVASAGNTVMAKVHGGGGGARDVVVAESEGERKGQQDKGVSVKDYLVEKLKPTEDDKALSDAISESLPWRRKADNAGEEESKPMGRVTETEEVKMRLGETADDDRKREEAAAAVEDSSASVLEVGGVAGKLKGAVESWFGK